MHGPLPTHFERALPHGWNDDDESYNSAAEDLFEDVAWSAGATFVQIEAWRECLPMAQPPVAGHSIADVQVDGDLVTITCECTDKFGGPHACGTSIGNFVAHETLADNSQRLRAQCSRSASAVVGGAA